MGKAAATHGVWRGLRCELAVLALAVAVAAIVFAAPSASADTTQTFTSPGCSAVSIPAGDNAVDMVAVGAAGQSTAAPGGVGGRASGTIVGVSGQLDVCVNVGAGPAVSCGGCTAEGAGGGASGVSLGGDFSRPVVVAGGGGGADAFVLSAGQGDGGAAGHPSGGTGHTSPACSGSGSENAPGKGGTQTAGGAGGSCGNPSPTNPAAPSGTGFTSSGPGHGGSGSTTVWGAGGGGGYYGGGGATNGGGGGGGSSFCDDGDLLPGYVSGCSFAAASGSPQVVLTFSSKATNPRTLIADIGNDRVVDLPPAGAPQTTIGAGLDSANGVAFDGAGNAFIADTNNNRVVKVAPDGGQTTISSDLSAPSGVAVDGDGNVLIADTNNNRVVEVPADGSGQFTLAGNLGAPYAVAADVEGNVLIADTLNDRVLKVPPGGGEATTLFSDGLASPEGVTADTAGNTYIADTGNDQVIKVTPLGTATTVASSLGSPIGVALDAAGDVFIGDTDNNQVLVVPVLGGPPTTTGSGLSLPTGVAVNAPPPTFDQTAPGFAPVGQFFTYTYTASVKFAEPAATFAVASGSLPPGLSLDADTGELSGKPTQQGAWTFRVRAENAARATVGRSTTITTAPAKVSAVSPTAGATAGGDEVTINGSGFTPDAGVVFGSDAASSVTYVSATELHAIAPPHAAGQVHVKVTTAAGQSALSAGDLFMYGGPAVTAVSPRAGSTGGGNTVTVSGQRFTSDATVSFGSSAASDVTVVSTSKLTATAPAAAAGTVHVNVSTPAGTSAGSTADLYSFGAPVVTGLSRNAGPVAGGGTITVTGAQFSSDATVLFGSTPASSVSFVGADTLKVGVPAGTAGTTDVTVTTAAGSSASSSASKYAFGAATVAGLTPAAGPTAGGTIVRIRGTGLVPGATVRFGSHAATGVAFVQSGSTVSLTATAPAGAAGSAHVTVTTPAGTSSTTAADLYAYGAPTVSSVSPNQGPLAGGGTVTVTGTGFSPGAKVSSGTHAASSVNVSSGTSLTARVPAGAAGPVDVTVQTAAGTSPASAGDRYTYDPVPRVTALSPAAGPTAGGTVLTVTGTGFTPGSSVTFGQTAASAVRFVSSTELRATTPAHAAGQFDLRVRTAGGTSATSAADRYTFYASPTITSLTPSSGPTGGGTSVVIKGTNFASGAMVKFGSAAAGATTVNSGTQITAVSPAASAGPVDVRVTTPGGTTPTGAQDSYVYGVPIVTGIDPNAGPVAGQNTVTITGSRFASGAQVKFGATSSSHVQVLSATKLTARVPAGTEGVVPVQVTTYTASAIGGAAQSYAYGRPTISAISPITGPTATNVTVTGTGFVPGATAKLGANTAAATVLSPTQIRVVVPDGAVPAKVQVTTPAGTATSSQTFTPSLAITSLSATFGPPGTVVTITGVGFNSGSTVKFNGVAASAVAHLSSTQLQATVPSGSTPGPVSVTNTAAPIGTVRSAGDFSPRGHQTIAFTSTAPSDTKVGDTYTATATGGASGNPVTFTIDPASTAVCTISGATVSFTANGTCTIDADQAGNADYDPAPEVQQSVAVKRSLYWANDTGSIGRAGIDGSGSNAFGSGIHAWHLAVDDAHIYWADQGGQIGRSNLDGSGLDASFITGAGNPRGVAVDDAHVYWADPNTSKIGRANLDGGSPDNNFISTGGSFVDGVEVDGSYVYWASYGTHTIGRANLDGTGANAGFIATTGSPTAVTTDGSHIYWTESEGRLGRANLDGGSPDSSFITGLDAPEGVAVDSAHVYWTNSGSGTIGRANLDGTSANESFITGTHPLGIALSPGNS